MSKSILIVDDHAMMRKGIQCWIQDNTEWTVTAEAGNSDEVFSILSEKAGKGEIPEIAIIDADLGKESGFDLVKQLKPLYPEIKIIMYSMHNEQGYVMNAKTAGALGYLSKASDPAELKKCIETVSRGQTYLEESMVSKNNRLTDYLEYFTKKEQQVLQEMLKMKNNEDISNTLNLSLHSVEVYVSKIYDKLGVHNREELAGLFG